MLKVNNDTRNDVIDEVNCEHISDLFLVLLLLSLDR